MTENGIAAATQDGGAQKEKIGFIGLGMMGHGIAKNIRDKGHELFILKTANEAAVNDMLRRGATAVQTPKEMAEAASIIFLCVTGSTQVEALVRGPDGLAAGLKSGAMLVDCSTSDPVSTLALAEELAAIGVGYVDAPLGRTPKEAWEGTLDAMIGSTDEQFQRLKPVLECWAGRIVHIGVTGDGHKMKLLNNFLAMGYAALYSEALALSVKVGISPRRFDTAIRNGRMDCGFYQTFMKWNLEGDRNAHKFSIANAFKDMRYLESMADQVGMVNPLGNAIKNSYAFACAAGGANDYVPMLTTYVGRLNGINLTPEGGQGSMAAE